MNDERTLAKVKKLLIKFVGDESQVDNFMKKLEAMKDEPEEEGKVEDSEQVGEEPKLPESDETKVGEPKDEVQEKVEDEEVGDEAEEVVEDKVEDEQPKQEGEPVEKVEEEVKEEQPIEEHKEEVDQKYDELSKAVDGLNAKIDSLMQSLTKSGVLNIVEQKPIGVEQAQPMGDGGEDLTNKYIRQLNGK